MNNKNLFKYVLIFIIAFCISIFGATYAYFAFSTSNNNSISGSASIVNMNLNVSRVYPVNNGGLIPQLSGSALNSALQQGCVDTNSNVVCQVYRIYVKNNGSSTVSVDGSISFFSDSEMTVNAGISMPNLKWMVVSSVDESNSSNSVLGNATMNAGNSSGASLVSNVSLAPNGDSLYYK